MRMDSGGEVFSGNDDVFRSRGFFTRRFPGYLRLVRDHCEIHVRGTSSGYLLEIPVLRSYPGEQFPDRVIAYIEERNASGKWPGTFVVRGDTIWCVCEAGRGEGAECSQTAARVADMALKLVEQVERLGPKILNLR